MPRPLRSPLSLLATRASAWALIAVILCVALRVQARPSLRGEPAPAASRRCWKHLVAERPSLPPELGASERGRGAADSLTALAPPIALVAPLAGVAPPAPRPLPAAFFAGPDPPRLPVYLRLLQLVL